MDGSWWSASPARRDKWLVLTIFHGDASVRWCSWYSPDVGEVQVAELCQLVRLLAPGIDNLRTSVGNPLESMRYSLPDHSHCFLLQRLPRPTTNHHLRRVAISSLLAQFARCRKAFIRTQHQSHVRDGVAMVPQVRAAVCQPVTAPSTSTGRQVAPR